ncbi:hypothetical protein DUI87_19068 [Hirundo rustica rustica]|uniref:Uncharacterized protein n=1 Tax=Hirundo rustica rustica TaxID=333673 RepID=A0A3M0JTW6_HIRRU|nr:hypothetical protein DUI87_19068 [Hirundo rustica rustica]
MAPVRSFWKLSPCPAEPMAYGSEDGCASDQGWANERDLKDAFFCLPLHEASQKIFAFEWESPKTGRKTQLAWCVLPQGYKNSPTIFGEQLAKDLESWEPPPGEGQLLQYVDDLLIATRTQETCMDWTQGIALGILAQNLGPYRRAVAYLSKQLDTAAKGWPGCLRAVAAVAINIQEARKFTLGQKMTVLVSHTMSAVLEAKGGHWLSPQRFLKYQAILVEQDDVEIVVTNIVNPASFLSGSMGEPVIHDCLETIEATYSSRPDLKDTPLEDADTWFTDGSSYVVSGRRHAGYAVTTSKEVIESGPLPTNTSVQKAEIIALIRALELAKGKEINIYTDSRYAFGVVHAHGAIWKERGLLNSQGKSIKHAQVILRLLDAIQLPERVAIMHIKVHQKVSSELEEGNMLADREAKEAAKGEVPDKAVEAALIPDGKVSIEGKPVYNKKDKKLIKDTRRTTQHGFRLSDSRRNPWTLRYPCWSGSHLAPGGEVVNLEHPLGPLQADNTDNPRFRLVPGGVSPVVYRGSRGGHNVRAVHHPFSQATIRDLCKAHWDYGRDSPYFRGLLRSNLEAAVVIPADLRQLFSCLMDSTEFKLWEAAWRQLLREALPSLLTDPETAIDGNGNALTLEQLMGEGRWTDPTDQASGIPIKALQTIREHAVTAFFSMVPDGPVIPYYKIVQGTKEAFTKFVEWLTRAIEVQVSEVAVREGILREMVFANANNLCRTAILSLPLDPPPTIQDMLWVCQLKVPYMQGNDQDAKATTPRVAAISGTQQEHIRRPLELTKALHLKSVDWTFLSVNLKEQGAWPVQGKELVVIGDCKYTPQEIEILPGILVNNPENLVLWLRCTHPPTFLPKGQVIAQVITTRGPSNTSMVPVACPVQAITEERPRVECEFTEPLLGRDLMAQWGVKIDIPDPSVDISTATIEERPTKKLNWLTDNPVWVEQWPLSKQKLKALEELVEEQLRKGHIVETDSPWNSPVFVIQKPGKDKWRLLQDLRQINNVIEDMGSLQPGMPSPTMLSENWKLAVIDIKDCFFQIPLHPDDAPRFAFSVPTINREAPRKRCHWRVLPQGMKNSPVICQWYVASLLSPVRAAAGQAIIHHYMDDVLVCAPTDDVLSHALDLTINALIAAGFELQEEKVQRMPPWKYLGLEIGKRTIVPQKLAIKIKWKDIPKKDRDGKDPRSIIEWVFLSHQRSKRMTRPQELVAEMIRKARFRIRELAGCDFVCIHIPIGLRSGQISKSMLEHLLQENEALQFALDSFTGQISIHRPAHKIFNQDVKFVLSRKEVRSRRPLKALTVFTDASGRSHKSVLTWKDPQTQQWEADVAEVEGSPQVAELAAVVRAFERFPEPFNLVTDSAYVVGVVSRAEQAILQEVSNIALYDLLSKLVKLVSHREQPFFVMHTRSHTELPGFIAEGNRKADALAAPAKMAPLLNIFEQAKLSHQLFHQNAPGLVRRFHLTREQAKAIVAPCPSCSQHAVPTLHAGVNPQGLRSCEVWQTDVTHFPEFGRQKYIHVSIDTFSGAVFAFAHTGEKVGDVIKHLIHAFSFLGIPKELKTDNGPAYKSRELCSFLQQWGVEHKTGIPHSPTGQAMVERTHGTIKRVLHQQQQVLKTETPAVRLARALFTINFLNSSFEGLNPPIKRHFGASSLFSIRERPPVMVRDPESGRTEGPHDLVTWGRGYACVSSPTGPRWIPSKWVRPYVPKGSGSKTVISPQVADAAWRRKRKQGQHHWAEFPFPYCSYPE